MDRWTQKRIQNPVKHLRWSILQKIFRDFYLLTIFTKQSISSVWQGSEYASGTLKVDKNFKQLLKFICFIDSKVVLMREKKFANSWLDNFFLKNVVSMRYQGNTFSYKNTAHC